MKQTESFSSVTFLCCILACVCVCSFPSCHFGKLYGMVMALSAVISVLQYPCFALVKGALDGDPLYVSALIHSPVDSHDSSSFFIFLHFHIFSSPACVCRWTSAWRCSAYSPSSIPSMSTFIVEDWPHSEPSMKPPLRVSAAMADTSNVVSINGDTVSTPVFLYYWWSCRYMYAHWNVTYRCAFLTLLEHELN